MSGAIPWARLVLTPAVGNPLTITYSGQGTPTLDDVDCLAHLYLAVRRAGDRITLETVSPALFELLDLAGLVGEMGGQTEGGEEVGRRFQEGVDPADTIA
jgi:hypothetical protein